MEIQVTYRDLADGEPGKACNCPVALAILRAIKAKGYNRTVEVFPTYASISGAGVTTRAVALPAEVTDFIVGYDEKRPQAPITFQLDYKIASDLLHPSATSEEASKTLSRMASDLMFGTITWGNTEEGHDYWYAVYGKLTKYAKSVLG